MDNTDYIEKFFTSATDAAPVAEFEKRIETDPAFAEEVAFYLSVLKESRERAGSERQTRFKHLYSRYLTNPVLANPVKTPVRKLVYSLTAAAAVLALIFGIYEYNKPLAPRQLAETYMKEHLQTLGVTMDGKADSMQMALGLYNNGQTREALDAFEKISSTDTSNFTAIKYAGLSALKLQDYNQALRLFNSLATFKGLYSNPALFYQAITYMQRNGPGDGDQAKQILQQIVDQNLEGKETAVEWLKKW